MIRETFSFKDLYSKGTYGLYTSPTGKGFFGITIEIKIFYIYIYIYNKFTTNPQLLQHCRVLVVVVLWSVFHTKVKQNKDTTFTTSSHVHNHWKPGLKCSLMSEMFGADFQTFLGQYLQS